MTNHAIHWSEGLFISPHHFQSSERRLQEQLSLAQEWNVGYAYGLRRIEIDVAALANWRVGVQTLHIRLRDGTLLRFPEDALLSPVDIPETAFRNPEDRLMVYVAVPQLQLGRANADSERGNITSRFVIESAEVEDENQSGNTTIAQFRWLNSRLLVGNGEVAGYETLPIMRLKLGSVAEAPPEIDPEYIPPLLACDAWNYLQKSILQNVSDYLGSLADQLARNMLDRGVAFQSGHREDLERIQKLQAVNNAIGHLVNLGTVRGIHPLTAYMDLSRVLGAIAIFRPERRMPTIPVYNHDDLGTCFHTVRKLIDLGERPMYIKRVFVGAGLQMQVRLDRDWITPGWTFYMGVETSLSFSDVENLLLKKLDLKIGSSDTVEKIYRGGRGDVKTRPEASPPRDFPGTNWTYWKLNRSSEAWQAVEAELMLAIRFNENQVVGKIDGEKSIQVRNDQGQLVALSFALFAMPQTSQ